MPELDKGTLKAISTETRQEILKMLSRRPYTASEIAKILGKHVTTISEHLSVLEKSGLAAKKDTKNKWLYYILTPKGEGIFKPQYYSWVIVLSVSILGLFTGINRFTFIPFAQKSLEAAGGASEPLSAAAGAID